MYERIRLSAIVMPSSTILAAYTAMSFARQQLSYGFDFQTWLRRTVAEHEQWLARIVFPTL